MSEINRPAQDYGISWEGDSGSQLPAAGGHNQPSSGASSWPSLGDLLARLQAPYPQIPSSLSLPGVFSTPETHDATLHNSNTRSNELPGHSLQESSDPESAIIHPLGTGLEALRNREAIDVRSPKRVTRRPRAPAIAETKWEQNKPHIERLYMKEDLPLPQVVEQMENDYGFSASFKVWKWVKNLPATWMAQKSYQRRPKKTTFLWNNQEWTDEKLARRAGKTWQDPGSGGPVACGRTPGDITYYTPRNESPRQCASSQLPASTHDRDEGPKFYLDTPPVNLDLKNTSLSQLNELLNAASHAASIGNVNEANADFRDAVSGFRFKLSPTHDETLKAAYLYACFYAKSGLMDKANAVLNWMSEHHVSKWGPRHDNVYLHYARMVELFRCWGRQEDAEVLVYKLLDDETDEDVNILTAASESQQRQPIMDTDLHRAFPETDDPDSISQQLNRIDIAIMSNIKGLNDVLEVMIRHCEAKPDDLAMALQACRAKCALAKWHSNTGHTEQIHHHLKSARTSIAPFLSIQEEPISRATLKAVTSLAYQFFDETDSSSCDDLLEEVITSLEARCQIFKDEANDKVFLLDFVQNIAFHFHEVSSWETCRYWVERGMGLAIRMHGTRSLQARRFQKILDKENFDMRSSISVQDLMKSSGGSFNIRLISNPAFS
ncbi:rhomboid family protein [Fusarium austroafricanum]|uniref:Rhomboid family protein n=1 Tax=Fusarium austroafricanum TaxID=2364996 RepID=A0A8H4KDA8_9HYPO|nr:rhomboid family protein [Fusarium austroafricanum]